jgi:hypothetical protein
MSSSDSSFSSSLAASGAASASAEPPAAAAPPEAAAPPAPPEGTEASFSEPEAMSSLMSLPSSSEISLSRRSESASIPTDSRTACCDVRLGQRRRTARYETYLDVGSGGRGVATKAEEEVCREVLHCDCGLVICRNRSSIDLTCACQYCAAGSRFKVVRTVGTGD